MPEEEERRSYVVLRLDGLLVYTRPVAEREALRLLHVGYGRAADREAVKKDLAGWGDVFDVEDAMYQLVASRWGRAEAEYAIQGLRILVARDLAGIYVDPGDLSARLADVLVGGPLLSIYGQPARELAGRVDEFVRQRWRPAQPEGAGPAARYVLKRRWAVVRLCRVRLWGSAVDAECATPRARWQDYNLALEDEALRRVAMYGISVFGREFWLWRQTSNVEALVVRRDVDDKEVAAAVLTDGAAASFLGRSAEYFRVLVDGDEDELREKGYADVVRKAKVALAAAALLTAGRREEDGVPA